MSLHEAIRAGIRFLVLMAILGAAFVLLHIAAVLPVLILGW